MGEVIDFRSRSPAARMTEEQVTWLIVFAARCCGPRPHWMTIELFYQRLRRLELEYEMVQWFESGSDDPAPNNK